jgi:signal transduction histidine kinase
MEKSLQKRQFRSSILALLSKYWLIVAGVVIYAYYLLVAVDMIQKGGEQRGFLDYLLQFDSLILLWIIAAIVVQIQRYRKQHAEEQAYRRKIQLEFERQKIHLQLLDEITTLLQDSINNPLGMISATSETIRKKFTDDDEIISWLDRIDASLKRIHATISEISQSRRSLRTEETTHPLI